MQPAPEERVPRERLIAALVNEAARARIRHRVLLEVLERRGLIDVREYIEAYARSEAADFIPFVELVLLSAEDFEARHGDWLAANLERYGYDGSARLNLVVESPRTGTESAVVPKPKSRKEAGLVKRKRS